MASYPSLLLLPDALIEEILVGVVAVDKSAVLGLSSSCKHIASLFRGNVCCVTRCLIHAANDLSACALQRATTHGHAPVVELLYSRFGMSPAKPGQTVARLNRLRDARVRLSDRIWTSQHEVGHG